MSKPHRRTLLSLLLLAGLGAPLAAQGFTEVPKDIVPFWEKYQPAHEADDEAEMDKAVRRQKFLAEQTLDLMLDDIAERDTTELRDEARALARSLDRVEGVPRFMERVRFALGLEPADRLRRSAAMTALNEAFQVLNAARPSRAKPGLQEALGKFAATVVSFEAIADSENAIVAEEQMAEIEQLLEHPWERSKHLQRIVILGANLSYRDPHVDAARFALGELKSSGIDPDGPRPGEGAPVDGEAPAPEAGGDGGGAALSGGGNGWTSFAEGATDQVFALELDAPKKGLTGLVLPSFAPLDQYLLWPYAWLEKDGPSEFDTTRPNKLQPFGKPFTFTREGAVFLLECDGDSKPELEFTPTTSPQRIDIPAPEGKDFYPLMVSVPGEKESMFGLEVNYSPQMDTGARVRFNLGGSMDGKVLGEPWKVLDTNISGRYGDVQPWWDDGVTWDDMDDQINYIDTDAVVIGKSKTAIPWSVALPVGEDFYHATLTPDGKSLTLRQLQVDTGFVKLDMAATVQPTHVVLKGVGPQEGAFLNVVPAKKGGSVKVPVGMWQLASGRIEKGGKTGMQQIRIYTGHNVPFEVKAGETATLALGAPYTVKMRASLDGKTTLLDGRTLRVWGRGEEYAVFFDEPLLPDVEFRSADGKKFGKPVTLRRPELADWQENKGFDNILWFPLDLRIDNPKAEALQFHVSQKAHPLLGGPFDSDWMP